MPRSPRFPRFLQLCLLVLAGPAGAFDFPAHSLSNTGQFVVFADEVVLRSRVAGFAEENKREVLALLDVKDEWKTPILISLQKPDPAQGLVKPAQVTLYDTGSGMKLQIDISLEASPDEVALQSRLVEALLLERAYRTQAPRHGEEYRRPPAWLIEGVTEKIRRKMLGGNPSVFETLLDANRLPPLAIFLDSAPNGVASAWTQVFRAGSLALLDQLLDLPGGRKALRQLIENIPESRGDAIAQLQKAFPALGNSEAALEKWWSLSVAKMAAANRYQGIGVAETERRLDALLKFTLKKPDGSDEAFELGDYRAFLKAPGAKAALARMRDDLTELGVRGNALHRSVVAGYVDVANRLLRRKTRGVDDRLTELAAYRSAMLRRIDDIADYLNWVEGTQLNVRSSAFGGYFHAASELESWRGRRSDPVTTYMNLVEKNLPPRVEKSPAVAQGF